MSSSSDQKVSALISDLSMLVANTTESVRSRGKNTVKDAAFMPESYPVSRDVYEAIFSSSFMAGDANGRMDLARKIVEYLKK